jgi:hypothetical protein
LIQSRIKNGGNPKSSKLICNEEQYNDQSPEKQEEFRQDGREGLQRLQGMKPKLKFTQYLER